MPYLADTNVIARRILPSDPQHAVVMVAVDTLLRRGETVYITPQNLVEFRALATRPVAANGFGMTSAEASHDARTLETIFTLAIYPLWRHLAERYEVIGRQVYIRIPYGQDFPDGMPLHAAAMMDMAPISSYRDGYR